MLDVLDEAMDLEGRVWDSLPSHTRIRIDCNLILSELTQDSRCKSIHIESDLKRAGLTVSQVLPKKGFG